MPSASRKCRQQPPRSNWNILDFDHPKSPVPLTQRNNFDPKAAQRGCHTL